MSSTGFTAGKSVMGMAGRGSSTSHFLRTSAISLFHKVTASPLTWASRNLNASLTLRPMALEQSDMKRMTISRVSFTEYLPDKDLFANVYIPVCLATGETKVIYETTGVNLAIQNVKSSGNKLFFTIQQNIYHEEKDDYERISKGLYVYDYESNGVTVLSEEDVHDYYVIPEDNLLYYYVTGKGLYCSNLIEHSTELIIKATKEVDMCNISYDGTYLYLSNIKWLGMVSGVVESATKKCIVVDKKGNTINEISCDGFLGIYFGDDRYMFARNMNNELVYIDKHEISTVTQWTSVLKEEMFLPTVRPQ